MQRSPFFRRRYAAYDINGAAAADPRQTFHDGPEATRDDRNRQHFESVSYTWAVVVHFHFCGRTKSPKMTIPRYVLRKLHTGMLFCPQRSAGMVYERPRSAGMAYRLIPSHFEH